MAFCWSLTYNCRAFFVGRLPVLYELYTAVTFLKRVIYIIKRVK